MEQAAGTGHTAPFTHAWRYFTKEIAGYADPVEVVYDFEDGTGDGLADGWQLYVGASDTAAYQYRYDPADEFGLWKSLAASGDISATVTNFVPAVENGELADSLALYTNDWDRAWGVMAYARGKHLLAEVVNGAETNLAVVVVGGGGNKDGSDDVGQLKRLMRTAELPNGELVAWGEEISGSETNLVTEADVTLIHSAVYWMYGYDPTTARTDVSEAVDAEGNATGGAANTAPFTYAWQWFTVQAGLADEKLLGAVDSDVNGVPDGWELYVDGTGADVSFGWNYDPADETGLWDVLVRAGLIGETVTNFVPAVTNDELVKPEVIAALTNDWNYANGVMAYAQTTAHVATNGTEKFVVVIAGADDPDGVVEGAVKTVLKTVTLPNGELVAWGETADVDVAGLPIGEEPVTLVHRAVYHYYGFEADTARGCVNDAAAPAGSGHTAPFTHAWRYFTKEIAGYADPVDVVYDFEDGTGDGLADGWQLYAGSSDTFAYKYGFDPLDDHYFYNSLMEQDPELAGSLPPYDNAFAITNGLANATVEEQKAFWDWAPEDDYMAYVQTNVLISVVTNAEGEASIYAIDPGTNTLYETFYVGGELFVGAVSSNDAAYAAMENGNFMTMVTNATVIHSAVYDWYGFDPTTAKPSYWWPESIAEYAESNSNYTVGANSVPFTRRLKYITQTMYLPLVGAEDDYFLTTSWTEDPSTWWTDTNGNDMPDGWELYVKYSAFSDPDKTDDDYKEDFIDSTDPNSEDTDGDGIPDDVEQYFKVTDPLVKDGDFAADGDVMAFATVNATVVTVQNSAEGSLPVRYLLAEEMAGNTVTAPKVGDYAGSLALRATYDYLVPSGADDGSVTNRCGVGTNVTLTAAAGTVNRVVAVSVEPVVLVHAQVYDYFGFDKETANATAVTMEGSNYVYGANTKAFTALDKYLVVRYFEAYGLADAAVDWKERALAPASSDNDLDGVPDGWELYVMFGTEGVTETLEAAKISPYNYNDARALAPAGDMTVLEKWNGGAPAYNPWATDTNGNGISDVDEAKYNLDEPYDDTDNDQLSDLMEYLIGNVFTNLNQTGISSTNGYSLVDGIPDYFRRVGNLYLGEMFADHDFMEDVWEDQYRVATVTRGLYDPWRDSDDDGWSNYAECRADTNPELPANTYGMKGMVIHNYPIPTIHAKIMMGPGEGMQNGTVVVQSYSDTSKMTGLPDAIWTVSVGSLTSEPFKYLGRNPNHEVSFTLSPGFVNPGSISMSFLDSDYEILNSNGVVVALGNINTAEWKAVVEDRPATDMATGKIIVSTQTNSLEIGTIDYHTGLMTVDYTKLPATWTYPADDPTMTNRLHLANSHVSASWEAGVASGNSWVELHLTDSASSERATLGHVREGKNTFVVFCGDGNGMWKPGLPYGVAKSVDVGWSDAEFTVELTQTTPIMARFDLTQAIGDSFATANKATDRGNVNTIMGYYINEPSRMENMSTNMPGNVDSLTRIRVVRNWIDDVARNTYTTNVLDRVFDLSVHPTLTEADLLADGEFDLDWGGAEKVYGAKGFTKVTYRVVIGDGDVGDLEYNANGKNLPVLFSNRFEPGARQTPTVPITNYTAQLIYPSGVPAPNLS